MQNASSNLVSNDVGSNLLLLYTCDCCDTDQAGSGFPCHAAARAASQAGPLPLVCHAFHLEVVWWLALLRQINIRHL